MRGEGRECAPMSTGKMRLHGTGGSYTTARHSLLDFRGKILWHQVAAFTNVWAEARGPAVYGMSLISIVQHWQSKYRDAQAGKLAPPRTREASTDRAQ